MSRSVDGTPPLVRDWKALLTALYTTYAPHKLPKVDRVLEKYVGQEEEMYAAFAEKYGAPPLFTNKPDAPDYRALLTALYAKHAPQKVSKIDAVLEKYKGHEEEMYAAFKEKYEGPTKGSRTAAAKATPPAPSYLGRLQAFYAQHNPSKVGECAALLKKYRGREEALFAKLEGKYSKQAVHARNIARLETLYREHNPAKVPKAAALLAKYQGREEDLFAALSAKYGVASSAPAPGATRPAPPVRVPPPQPAPLDEAKVARLEAIYRVHNPAKVPKARALLRQWEGREEDLFKALRLKYPPVEPRDPNTVKASTAGLMGQLGIGIGGDAMFNDADPTEDAGDFFAEEAAEEHGLDRRGGASDGGGGSGSGGGGGGLFDGGGLDLSGSGSGVAASSLTASTATSAEEKPARARRRTHTAGRAFDFDAEQREDPDDVDVAALVAERQHDGLFASSFGKQRGNDDLFGADEDDNDGTGEGGGGGGEEVPKRRDIAAGLELEEERFAVLDAAHPAAKTKKVKKAKKAIDLFGGVEEGSSSVDLFGGVDDHGDDSGGSGGGGGGGGLFGDDDDDDASGEIDLFAIGGGAGAGGHTASEPEVDLSAYLAANLGGGVEAEAEAEQRSSDGEESSDEV